MKRKFSNLAKTARWEGCFGRRPSNGGTFSLLYLSLVAGLFQAGCHAINVAQHRAHKPAGNPPGKLLYETHCTKCHSLNPTSIFPELTDTPALPLDDPMRMSLFPRDYLIKIITEGGKSVGRSKVMPRWDEVFTEEEISRIVDYLTGTSSPDGTSQAGN